MCHIGGEFWFLWVFGRCVLKNCFENANPVHCMPKEVLNVIHREHKGCFYIDDVSICSQGSLWKPKVIVKQCSKEKMKYLFPLGASRLATAEFTRPLAHSPRISNWTSLSFNSLSSSKRASISRLRLNAAFSSLGLRFESARCSCSSAMFTTGKRFHTLNINTRRHKPLSDNFQLNRHI